MRSFARTLAADFAPRNIRVNIISRGPIQMPVLGKLGPIEIGQRVIGSLISVADLAIF